MQSTRVKLAFTHDEALVLYDWLTRFNQRDKADVADQAEERVREGAGQRQSCRLSAALQSLLARFGMR